MKKLLTIKNLKKTYHDTSSYVDAIDDLNLDIYDQEYIAIVGPSGCGKSTILSILTNLEDKSSGEITFNKDNLTIGYMLQDDALFPWLTILENCYLGLKIKNIFTEENKNNVKRLLNTYGLGEFINKYPSNLSGGMRQRVALIRTLAINPDILLLDEPFSRLDYITRLNLSNDIYRIIKEEKKTVIMVSHDLAESISLADRIIVLSKRPCKVKCIYNIELTGKSNPIENRKCKEFNYYYDKIWRDLDEHI